MGDICSEVAAVKKEQAVLLIHSSVVPDMMLFFPVFFSVKNGVCARVPVCVCVSLSTGGDRFYFIVTLLFHNFLSFYFSLHLTFLFPHFEKRTHFSPVSSTCEYLYNTFIHIFVCLAVGY